MMKLGMMDSIALLALLKITIVNGQIIYNLAMFIHFP